MAEPVVGIVMGSDSDWPVMEAAAAALAQFDVPYEADVVSAHRMPEEMLGYGKDAAARGLKVIIAGAGGAAHLPGMLAAVTPLPVIGVPVALKYLDGMDSLLSIVQMPAGVPVATVAVGNARNAGLLAVRILAAGNPQLQQKMSDFQAELRTAAHAKGKTVRDETLELAEYIFVLTTPGLDVLSAAEVLELYRARWQVEVGFKRLKSLFDVGSAPSKDPDAVRSWIYAKLLAVLLIERLGEESRLFSPWGFPLGSGQPVEGVPRGSRRIPRGGVATQLPQ